jgi:hypothetical protein
MRKASLPFFVSVVQRKATGKTNVGFLAHVQCVVMVCIVWLTVLGILLIVRANKTPRPKENAITPLWDRKTSEIFGSPKLSRKEEKYLPSARTRTFAVSAKLEDIGPRSVESFTLSFKGRESRK